MNWFINFGVNMRILIIGSGGVGGFYGAKLVQAGHDVTFVARGKHLEAMRQTGLQIEGDSGISLALQRVAVVEDPRTVKHPDLVLIAVKLWDLKDMAAQLKDVVGPSTTVLSLQNGVVKDIVLKKAFGDKAVIGGVGYVATSIGRPGVIKQVGNLQKIRLGTYGGAASPLVSELANSLAGVGVDALVSDDIQRVLWEKFVFLVGLSSMTCLTRLTIGPIRENPVSRHMLQCVISEAVNTGLAHKVALPPGYAATAMALVDQLPYTMTSSMFHDLDRGNRLELPWLGGGVISLAEEAGVQVPVNQFIADALSPHVNGRPAVK
jgi:2-dehydropantoate 2-reductase